MLEHPTYPSIFEAMSDYLDKAYLKNANLMSINLNEANLKYADLSDADLICADLSGADLRGADLEFVQNISEAIFWRTKYNDNTKFPEGFVVSEPKFVKIE